MAHPNERLFVEANKVARELGMPQLVMPHQEALFSRQVQEVGQQAIIAANEDRLRGQLALRGCKLIGKTTPGPILWHGTKVRIDECNARFALRPSLPHWTDFKGKRYPDSEVEVVCATPKDQDAASFAVLARHGDPDAVLVVTKDARQPWHLTSKMQVDRQREAGATSYLYGFLDVGFRSWNRRVDAQYTKPFRHDGSLEEYRLDHVTYAAVRIAMGVQDLPSNVIALDASPADVKHIAQEFSQMQVRERSMGDYLARLAIEFECPGMPDGTRPLALFPGIANK